MMRPSLGSGSALYSFCMASPSSPAAAPHIFDASSPRFVAARLSPISVRRVAADFARPATAKCCGSTCLLEDTRLAHVPSACIAASEAGAKAAPSRFASAMLRPPAVFWRVRVTSFATSRMRCSAARTSEAPWPAGTFPHVPQAVNVVLLLLLPSPSEADAMTEPRHVCLMHRNTRKVSGPAHLSQAQANCRRRLSAARRSATGRKRLCSSM
mmetsp:Transcript_130133/g.417586  ORF Transcript_130133/g.417586 Transcript_130133/m.417586 type:complete len:212 (-) Transcript_130133:884-1519(-)